MKSIALIVIGIVAAVIAAVVIMISTLPTAKMTIQAIRPTGKFVTGTNWNGTVMTGQFWEFGITNVGRARAHWVADVCAHTLSVAQCAYPTAFCIPADGILKPGEGVVTNMIVPFEDKPEWSG